MDAFVTGVGGMKYFQKQLLTILFGFLVLSFLDATVSNNFGCLNHEGEFVDWWVIYKEFKGERYVYLDSSMQGNPLGISNDRKIYSNDSPITRTILSTGYPNIKLPAHDPFYLTWNDQPHKGDKIQPNSAHAKVKTYYFKSSNSYLFL